MSGKLCAQIFFRPCGVKGLRGCCCRSRCLFEAALVDIGSFEVVLAIIMVMLGICCQATGISRQTKGDGQSRWGKKIMACSGSSRQRLWSAIQAVRVSWRHSVSTVASQYTILARCRYWPFFEEADCKVRCRRTLVSASLYLRFCKGNCTVFPTHCMIRGCRRDLVKASVCCLAYLPYPYLRLLLLQQVDLELPVRSNFAPACAALTNDRKAAACACLERRTMALHVALHRACSSS